MALFFARKQTEQTPEEVMAELSQLRERGEYLLSTTLALISCAKEFAFGFKEVDPDKFTSSLEDLKKKMIAAGNANLLKRHFADQPESISRFVKRQKEYLAEREAELTSTIDMLRTNMTAIFGENQNFTVSMQERTHRMERIGQLEDIRHLKEQLKSEVEQIKTVVKEKQLSDLRRMDNLTREVESLRRHLIIANDVSQTDCLTNAYNRFAFDCTLQRMVDRFQISGARFSLLLCDLDDFKKINDTYGHQVGDRVLASFVHECKSFFRDRDFIARYGGEEFAILLPGANLRDAVRRARTFARALAVRRFIIDKAKPEQTIAYTTSIGVSEIRRNDTPEAIIERADRALYLAKRLGKNRAMSDVDVRRHGDK